MAPSVKDAIEAIRTAALPRFEADLDAHIRIINDQHSDGLGYSPLARSRFSDPDQNYGVIYAGQDLATSVAEVIVRDSKVGNPDRMLLSYARAVGTWRAVSISSKEPLRLLNLTGVGLIRFGVPSNIIRQKSQLSSRRLAQAIHSNKTNFDGILYGSRLTTGQCIAVFDRGLKKLKIENEIKLTELESDLADVYRSMNIGILPK
jgi:RES domain